MAHISILDCPQEVQLQIVRFACQSDLARLSLTCHALHNLTEPLIYSSVKFEWAREFHPPITQLMQLLRTLLERQDLCPLIRHADFEGFGYRDELGSLHSDWTEEALDPPPVIPELPTDQLSAAIGKTGVSKAVVEQWFEKVQSGSPEASAAPEHASEVGLPSFTSLKHVSLALLLHLNRHRHPSNTADALALFYLPNIETLSVSIDNPTSFTWPSSSPPKPISLKSLEIFRLRESRLAPVLSVATNLKKLKYNWMYCREVDDEVSKQSVMLGALSEALIETKDSLEELEIIADTLPSPSCGEYEPPDVTFQGSISRLSEMHKLKTLYIPWTFLTGRKGLYTGPGLIGAAIPLNVEHLALDGFVTWSEDDCVEDTDELMVDGFAKELESGALLHLKSLKSVCLPNSLFLAGLSEILENRMRALEDRFGLALSYDKGRDRD
ncbi:unnamed protein product [Fusarium graminearum]|nr:unnamed protein product [Fusarium graminearum]